MTAVRLGHRISVAAPHAAVTPSLATRDRSSPTVPANLLAPGTDRLPTKKSKQGSSSRGGAPVENNAWPTNNWQTLLGGGNAAATATAAATTVAAGAAAGANSAVNNGGLNSNADKRKNKNKKKNKGKSKKLTEFENGTAIRGAAAPSPPDSSQPRPNPGAAASNPRTGDLLSVSNGSGKAGKKRTRKGANSAVDSTAPAPPNARTGGGHFQKQRPSSAEVASANNRPRSNVLNLAFQASRDGAERGGQEGAKKGRGKGGGGGGKGSKKGSQQALTAAEEAQYVGLDCEMVGVGPAGCRSALARCCMVDWNGNVM